MIALFTDFGHHGPYVGQMHAQIAAINPRVPIIDLLHHAPAYDAKRSAYLLKALTDNLPSTTIVVAVVDPGVGSNRNAIAVLSKGRWLIGPDNGLFALFLEQDRDARVFEITYQPTRLSTTFHGRDLFAPVAAQIAKGNFDGVVANKTHGHSITRDFSLLWPKILAEIIFIDDYGNATTGITAGSEHTGKKVSLNYSVLPYKQTFSKAKIGQPFWTINSMGLIEIAANKANAAKLLSLKVGNTVKLI